MSGLLGLDWAALAVSLFNTILLIWLGLTVLLTAERRTWGVGLVGGSLLLAGAFFISHTALLGLNAGALGGNLAFWWRLGGLPVTALPLAWYAVTLWYSGFWDTAGSPFQRRQRPRLMGAAGLALLVALLFLAADPLAGWQPGAGRAVLAGLIGLFAVYSVAVIGLALAALRQPGPSARPQADLARRRAHPWLIGATLVLWVISFLVAGGLLWTAANSSVWGLTELARRLVGLDLIVAALIAAATVLAGQAIVVYEVFTGRPLPRGGLRRHWRNALILAAGYGVAVGGSLAINLRPVYSLLLTAVLMTGFLALFSWRAVREQAAVLGQLRPFVGGAHLVDRLLLPEGPAPEVDLNAPFRALCGTVLGAEWARLDALGPLAPLAGPALRYGAEHAPAAADLPADFRAPGASALALEPGQFGPAHWAVPLWSERGLIGVLWLSAKAGGHPYTQEEIEIARATGERLIDTQISAELARRLLALQRERLAESQILDRQTQRALHDEVLPDLHAAVLQLGGAAPEALAALTRAHKRIADLLRPAPPLSGASVHSAGLVPALQALLTEEFGRAFAAVSWEATPAAEAAARRLPALAAEVLFFAAREALRNAARHGRPPDDQRPLRVRVELRADDHLRLTVEDDGAGLPEARPAAGGGRGLALHGALLSLLGGALSVESERGRYTRVRLTLPAAPA